MNSSGGGVNGTDGADVSAGTEASVLSGVTGEVGDEGSKPVTTKTQVGSRSRQ